LQKLTKYKFATNNYEVSTGHTKGYNAANIKQTAERTHTYKWTEYGLEVGNYVLPTYPKSGIDHQDT